MFMIQLLGYPFSLGKPTDCRHVFATGSETVRVVVLI